MILPFSLPALVIHRFASGNHAEAFVMMRVFSTFINQRVQAAAMFSRTRFIIDIRHGMKRRFETSGYSAEKGN
jgi:hypothetical protein